MEMGNKNRQGGRAGNVGEIRNLKAKQTFGYKTVHL